MLYNILVMTVITSSLLFNHSKTCKFMNKKELVMVTNGTCKSNHYETIKEHEIIWVHLNMVKKYGKDFKMVKSSWIHSNPQGDHSVPAFLSFIPQSQLIWKTIFNGWFVYPMYIYMGETLHYNYGYDNEVDGLCTKYRQCVCYKYV
uniref:Uncharacterized protein n=1 Tax=viral metagenome TaxID=1070528 RepID=A0A6C0J4N2_9ZZZZ